MRCGRSPSRREGGAQGMTLQRASLDTHQSGGRSQRPRSARRISLHCRHCAHAAPLVRSHQTHLVRNLSRQCCAVRRLRCWQLQHLYLCSRLLSSHLLLHLHGRQLKLQCCEHRHHTQTDHRRRRWRLWRRPLAATQLHLSTLLLYVCMRCQHCLRPLQHTVFALNLWRCRRPHHWRALRAQ